MRIVNYGAGDGTPCVLLLGYFDGVHVGHRALISFAAAHAREYGCGVAVMTFRGAKNGGQIYTLSERCAIFAELGETVFTFCERAMREGIEVRYSIPEIAAPADADPNRLKQVFMNIL